MVNATSGAFVIVMEKVRSRIWVVCEVLRQAAASHKARCIDGRYALML
jgi:hypothetical protein